MSGLSKLTINVGADGLGRRPINKDKVSGILFYNDTLPSGFTTTNKVKKVFSLSEAETLGLAKGSASSAVEWYHISEYFRGNPEGELWIGYFPIPVSVYDFTEIETMVNIALGEIRLLGIYANGLTFASTQVTTIQSVINGLSDAYRQFSVFYAANMAAITPVTGWAAVTDLRTLTAKKVTTVIAESGTGEGAALAAIKSYSITSLGLALGEESKASVEQSIGNPQNFNISNGIEMELPALANGDLVSSLTSSALGGLKDKGYLVARKYTPDISGTFFERVPTAISATSDYAWIEYNRTVDKAIRLIRTALVPQLQSTLLLKSDGTLRDDTVGYFQDLAQTPIDQMKSDSEISDGQVLINPAQDVLGTSKLTITVKIIPVGIAEEIVVNIGLTTKL